MPEPDQEPEIPAQDQTVAKKVSRRQMFMMTLGVGLNAIAGALFAVPVLGYILSPGARKEMKKELSWITLGALTNFPEGETRLATYRNPFVRPWDGDTGSIPCWVRRISGEKFQVFAINCTHLGCPVRWFPQSGLFMCPCHGGAYYADGERASGPPPRGLFEYDFKIEDGELWIKAGQVPTLAQPPSQASTSETGRCTCA